MAKLEFEDALDKILNEIETDYIPFDFVSAACVTDFEGEVFIISREELDEIVSSGESLEDQGIAEIGVIPNIPDIKEAIRHFSELILKDVAV